MISHSQSAPVLQNLNQVAETPNSVIEDEASSCSVQVQAKEDSCADLAGDVADEAAAERTEAAALAAALEEMPSQVSVPGSLVASDELKQLIGDYATPEVLDTIPHAERVQNILRDLKETVQKKYHVPDWVKVMEKDKATAVLSKEGDRGKDRTASPHPNNATVGKGRSIRKDLQPLDPIFPAWMQGRADFQKIFHRFASGHIDLTDVALIACRKHPQERIPQDIDVLEQWISANVPQLRDLGSDRCRLLCSKLKLQRRKQGEYIYEKGDPANAYYMVMRGQIRIEDGNAKNAKELKPCEAFGIDGLVENRIRTQNARVLSKHVWLVVLRGFTYRKALHTFEQNEKIQNQKFLIHRVPMLQHWSMSRLLALSSFVQLQRFVSGTTLAKQGEHASGFRFIRSGTACTFKEISYEKQNRWPIPGDEWQVVKRSLRQMVKLEERMEGQYIGEEILMGVNVNSCTIIAQSPIELLIVPPGPALDMFKRQGRHLMKAHAQQLKSADQVATEYLRDMEARKRLDRTKLVSFGPKYASRVIMQGEEKVRQRAEKLRLIRKRRAMKKASKSMPSL
eukprot:g3611.t1